MPTPEIESWCVSLRYPNWVEDAFYCGPAHGWTLHGDTRVYAGGVAYTFDAGPRFTARDAWRAARRLVRLGLRARLVRVASP